MVYGGKDLWKKWIYSLETLRLTIMEVEFEVWNHNFHNILGVSSETFFELTSITDQHLTRRRFLLQTRRSNTKTLLHTKTHALCHSVMNLPGFLVIQMVIW